MEKLLGICPACGRVQDGDYLRCNDCGTDILRETLVPAGGAEASAARHRSETTAKVPIHPLAGRHPLRRFFARKLDISLFILLWLAIAFPAALLMIDLLGSIVRLVLIHASASSVLTIALLVLLAAVGICVAFTLFALLPIPEAYLLSRYGSTPGKWLLSMRITESAREHALLTFRAAYKRTALLYVVGLGCTIPPLSLAAQAFAYYRLRRTGTTFWDRRTGSHPQFYPLEKPRLALFFALYVLLIAANIYFQRFDI